MVLLAILGPNRAPIFASYASKFFASRSSAEPEFPMQLGIVRLRVTDGECADNCAVGGGSCVYQ